MFDLARIGRSIDSKSTAAMVSKRPIADLHKVEKPPVCMGFAGIIFQISNTTMTLHAREFE